jgi:hypothetical protein
MINPITSDSVSFNFGEFVYLATEKKSPGQVVAIVFHPFGVLYRVRFADLEEHECYEFELTREHADDYKSLEI